MNERFDQGVKLFGAWCALGYCVLLFVGWWGFAGFLPLHEPSANAEDVAAFFRGDVTAIRFGMLLVMWGAACFIPFTAP